MNRNTLPRALFMALVAVAAAPPAAALPPVRVEIVDDATLGTLNGKYFGANLLVGLRIDLVSSLSTAQGGTANATGSLQMIRVGNGFDVRVDSRSSATEGTAATGLPHGSAVGAQGLQVDGIGQVSQIAGDGNRMTNLTTISFMPATAGGAGQFNGATSSSASAGGMTAQVTFLDRGLQLALSGPGAGLTQQLHASGANGQVLQSGQIAGNGMVGFNQLQLQLMTSPMSNGELHQLGVRQALAGLDGLGR
ncbi:hypothetical protein GCM10027191_27030 [Novilysobacter erysipheiresistens]